MPPTVADFPQSFIFGFFTVIVSVAGAVASASWRGRGFFAEAKEDFRRGIEQVRDEIRKDRDDTFEKFGESVAAVREKVNDVERLIRQVELWSRDNFVKREDFVNQLTALTRSIEGLSARVETNARYIESKIEKIRTRDENAP